MSDTQTNTPQEEEKKDLLELYIADNEKLVFPTLAYSTLTSTDELCMMAKIIFSNFKDYYGTSVNYVNGELTLSVHFAQIDERDSDAYYAFESAVNTHGDKESGLNRVKKFDRILSEGNKFSLSEDGKSAISKYMSRRVKDDKGNVKWNMNGVVTQYVDPQVFGGQPITCNVINYVSPIAILNELYGTEAKVLDSVDENGNAVLTTVPVEYDIIVLSLLQQNFNNAANIPVSEGPFKIDIRQINKNQLKKSAQQVGMNLTMGRNIIR